MSNSSTPTNAASENNPSRRSPLSNQHSSHSSVQSSPRQNFENDNITGIEHDSSIRSDSGSDREIVQHKRVKRHILESPSHEAFRSRSSSSSGSITPTQSPKNEDTNSRPFSENRLIKESPWEITEADTLKNNTDNEDIDDLFGGAVSDDEEQNEYSQRDSIEAASQISDDEKYSRPRTFNTSNYELAYAKPPGSCDGKYYIAKLPNFFTYCTQAYAPESYTEEDDYKHGTTIRLGAENTIRWRYKRNEIGAETEVKESNAKMIKWSDGSLSLLIGEEMFLINSSDISKQHTFLGVPNVHSNSIENHARLTNQITFRPVSNSRTHKRLSAAIQARNVKQIKTKFVDINDPKFIELQLQGEREKKPREKRATMTSKSRSRKRSYDDYSDPDESIPYMSSYKRNDSYDDDTGFVVADENDSDSDYDGRTEKRRKGKERVTESRKKKDLSSDEDKELSRTRKRHLKKDKVKSFDEYEGNGQEGYEKDEDMGDVSPERQENEDLEEVNDDVDIDESHLFDNDEEEDEHVNVKKQKRKRLTIDDDDYE